MKQLTLLVGPPGSGKSTYATNPVNGFGTTYVNQDSQGKEGHLKHFQTAIAHDFPFIIVDRMNFSKEQRNRYLIPAKAAGYRTKIVVLHESFDTCFKHCLERKNHETIKSPKDARNALGFFFKKYERVEDNEADEVVRIWPKHGEEYASWSGELVKVPKRTAIVSDLDGTLFNIDHRLHFVRGEGKKNWKGFFQGIPNDSINEWCATILNFSNDNCVILCSGRPDSYRPETEKCLKDNGILYERLFMRSRDDFRQDNVIKEILFEFEIKTRYNVLFVIDDRAQVVQMWRKHGLVCLQCAPGNF